MSRLQFQILELVELLRDDSWTGSKRVRLISQLTDIECLENRVHETNLVKIYLTLGTLHDFAHGVAANDETIRLPIDENVYNSKILGGGIQVGVPLDVRIGIWHNDQAKTPYAEILDVAVLNLDDVNQLKMFVTSMEGQEFLSLSK